MKFPYKPRPKAVGRKVWNQGKKGVMPTPWNKGKKLPYPVWNKGKKTGYIPWNKDGTHSIDARKKMSISHTGKPMLRVRGINHWNWKGGISSLYKQIQTSLEWKQWREQIFKRDDWTCQHCGKHGGRLHPDHIKPFAVIIYENRITSLELARNCKELWDIGNGRTLCIPCHKKTETWGVRTYLLLKELKQSGELLET